MVNGHRKNHQDEHHDGGVDEIGEGSLKPQIPTSHAGTHLAGGSDAISGLNANQIADGSVTNAQFELLGDLGTEPIADKEYVDQKIQGLDWQESVLSIEQDPPGTPSEGDRYLVDEGATGDWSGWDDSIVEWNGSEWIRIEPDPGFATFVEDIQVQKLWNGTEWVKFGSTISHSALLGLNADDHTQYLLVDGTRAMSGNLNMGLNSITAVNDIIPTGASDKNLGTAGDQWNFVYTDRVLANGVLKIGDDLDTIRVDVVSDANFLKDLTFGKDGNLIPRIIGQDSEPTIPNGSIIIWHDTTVNEEAFWILYHLNGTQYKVELWQSS